MPQQRKVLWKEAGNAAEHEESQHVTWGKLALTGPPTLKSCHSFKSTGFVENHSETNVSGKRMTRGIL